MFSLRFPFIWGQKGNVSSSSPLHLGCHQKVPPTLRVGLSTINTLIQKILHGPPPTAFLFIDSRYRHVDENLGFFQFEPVVSEVQWMFFQVFQEDCWVIGSARSHQFYQGDVVGHLTILFQQRESLHSLCPVNIWGCLFHFIHVLGMVFITWLLVCILR